MTQAEKLQKMVDYLEKEHRSQQRKLHESFYLLEPFMQYRALVNIRAAKAIDDDFLALQDDYLSELSKERGIVEISEMMSCKNNIFLWQGDITRLAVSAIVNAANSAMVGCFSPLHDCIDNIIHTYSGVQLRLACSEIMTEQGHEEATGTVKVTSAYNLPSDFVFHTVGPIVDGKLTEKHCKLLKAAYNSCLEKAHEMELQSIAFCCISTGVFRFPQERAAEIAVQTVREFLAKNKTDLRVVFNVFKDDDYRFYAKLLG